MNPWLARITAGILEGARLMRERDDSDEITSRRKARLEGQGMLFIAVLVAVGVGALICGGGAVALWLVPTRVEVQPVPVETVKPAPAEEVPPPGGADR
jgi:hypothetical protein